MLGLERERPSGASLDIEPSGALDRRLYVAQGHLGKGVFARVAIAAGETLAIFGGQLLDISHVEELPAYWRRYCLQIEEEAFLFSQPPSSADFVNHGCDANAGLRGQVVLVSLRPIAVGEEVLYDYGTSDGSPYDEFACRCQSAQCRGRVTAEDWRRPDLQLRYRGYFSPYLERRIRNL